MRTDVAGRLEVGEAVAHALAELIGRRGAAGPDHDVGAGDLAPPLVRAPRPPRTRARPGARPARLLDLDATRCSRRRRRSGPWSRSTMVRYPSGRHGGDVAGAQPAARERPPRSRRGAASTRPSRGSSARRSRRGSCRPTAPRRRRSSRTRTSTPRIGRPWWRAAVRRRRRSPGLSSASGQRGRRLGHAVPADGRRSRTAPRPRRGAPAGSARRRCEIWTERRQVAARPCVRVLQQRRSPSSGTRNRRVTPSASIRRSTVGDVEAGRASRARAPSPVR